MNPEMQQAIHAIRQRQFAAAADMLAKILESQPDNAQARWLLVQSLEQQQDVPGALEQLRLLLLHVQTDLAAIDQIAGYLRQRQYPLDIVLRAYEEFLKDQPASENGAFNYAYNLSKAARFEDAIRQYKQALNLGVSAPEEVHLNIANIYMDHLQAHDDAKDHLQSALDLKPNYASAYYNLGNLAEQEGDRDSACRYFEKSLQLEPSNESALARYADAQQFESAEDPLFSKMVAAAARSTNSDLHFALGKAYEQLQDFDSAWEHFAKGNAFDAKSLPAYSRQQTTADFSRIKETYSRDWLEGFADASPERVFICGMFRSGSTLLEQMLASHPAFEAGGESEFFPRLIANEFPNYPKGAERATVESVSAWQEQHLEQSRKVFGESARITDKRPDNFLYIGLIKAVFPNAKFIVTERDWRDIATSIYSVRLGPSQAYATKLKDIQHYVQQQTELIDHWAATLGEDLKRVRYEDLVEEPQSTITDLLEWLGESWDERCLAFHDMKNSVKTASVWQVREPLHAKSVGRWQNYEQQFQDGLDGDPSV